MARTPGWTRRDLGTLGALLPAAAAGAAAEAPAAQQTAASEGRDRWNVVFITGDHLRWNHVAANGNPHILTPNLDRLIARGTTVLGCHTVGVACSPNRGSLFTGRYPHAHGMRSNGVKMPETEVTLTHVLRENGYYCGQMGKLHFWPHSGRNHREPHPAYGFHQLRLSDEPGCYDDAFGLWLDAQGPEVRRKANVTMPGDRPPFEHYTFEGAEDTTHAHWVASETVRFIEENKGRPFFVHAGFYAPHPPLNPPASMLDLYRDRELPPRLYRDDEANYAPPHVAQALRRFAKTPEDTWTSYRKHFYAMVSNLDRNAGRIVEAVEQAGLLDRTLFVVTSDHGDYLGDHHLMNKSDLPYDGAMRVPLIFAGPGVPKARRVDELTEMVDVMPTILDLLGIPLPAGNQGKPLTEAFQGGGHKNSVYMLGPNNRILTNREARYAIWGNGQEVLFDLANDPNQFRNLSGEAKAQPLLAEMRKSLLQKEIELLDPLPEKVAPY